MANAQQINQHLKVENLLIKYIIFYLTKKAFVTNLVYIK
ncbi:hypothetical protein SAMN05421747_103104 [Parapedobacter composti]|uniref:Uncharacterized protein n=1 Tax=Parapedobacter composti TaxID=623281 RepID=A0A1I1FQT8_9SPHI|nr:hypothetical protein SAMN05421747_103104 [Parapedobacter composti]